MIKEPVPEAAVAEWSAMKLVEGVKAMLLASSQSHFLNLKLGDHLLEVCQGNLKLKEKVNRLRTDLRAASDHEQRLSSSHKKLKASETTLLKDNDDLLAKVAIL